MQVRISIFFSQIRDITDKGNGKPKFLHPVGNRRFCGLVDENNITVSNDDIVEDLYLVDDDIVILDKELLPELSDDLGDFFDKLMKD